MGGQIQVQEDGHQLLRKRKTLFKKSLVSPRSLNMVALIIGSHWLIKHPMPTLHTPSEKSHNAECPFQGTNLKLLREEGNKL
jgi:hypothetical protein